MTSRVSTLAALALLLGGCSVLYDSDLPTDCVAEEEDVDGDGVVSPECARSEQEADCDDDDPDVFPGATEDCNGYDDDCDGRFDEGLTTNEYFPDCDGDGVGDDLGIIELDCVAPPSPMCPDGSEGVWSDVAGDCDDGNPNRAVACGSCAQIDFLIVMDTSNSMEEEQMALARQLHRFVDVLKTGVIDGGQRAEPIEDIHVGVITPDLGTGRYAVPTCSTDGDDALLQRTSGAPTSECAGFGIDPDLPPFLSFSPEDADADVTQFTSDWACLVSAGTGGCGFEQPLESALKALTPARSALRFRGDTLGHGDGQNSEFLRDGSLLVVLVVTDEDDCSPLDPAVFDPESSDYPGDLNLRCHDYPDAVQPVSRYVSGLLQLRSAEDLIFAVVAGVPNDLVPPHGEVPDFEGILDDPRMEELPDPIAGTRLQFSCAIPTRGAAFPPRRLIEVAEGLDERGSTTVVSSICSLDSYSAVAEAVLLAAVDHSARRCGGPPME